MKAPKEERRGSKSTTVVQAAPGLKGAVHFFRTTISPVDGDRCPMYPTCSQYGEEAVKRHGSIVGLLMIVDRLFHEWSETSLAPTVTVYGRKRYWDPLDENDFWLISGGGPLNSPGMGGWRP
jgi:uncharacterized protein